MFEFTVEVRDKTLARLGQIRMEDLNLTVNEQFNNVGDWTLSLPIEHRMVPALRTPGAGIIVTRVDTGAVLFSGPVVSPEVTESGSDPGTVVITGATDTLVLADRLAYPQPSNVDPTAQTLAYDVRTGAAEDLLYAYVNANIGPSAPSARKDSRLTLGTNSHRGDTVTKSARFPQLGSLLSEIASAANVPTGTARPLGFRVVQVGSNLQFQTYATVDRSAAVRFDVVTGSLASSKVATAAPGLTRVIVAGQGEGTDRSFLEASTAASIAAETAWGRRIESFKDQRQTSDPAELGKAAADALANGFALSQFNLQITPGDDTAWVFGVDWSLGDVVTVVVSDGAGAVTGTELSTMVTGWVLKAGPAGIRFGALLGSPTASAQASFEARVSNLERNEFTGVSNPFVGPNFTVQDLVAPTKAYRFRTSGAALDMEAGGQSMYMSTWTNADFTGTQYTKLILPRDDSPVNAAQGIYKALPTTGYVRINTITPTWSNATTSYTDVTGVVASIQKFSPYSKLRIEVGGTFYTIAGSVGIVFAVLVNGVDTGISQVWPGLTANAHTPFTGVAYVTGLAAGTWTVQLRGRATSAAAGPTMDFNDWAFIDIQETN